MKIKFTKMREEDFDLEDTKLLQQRGLHDEFILVETKGKKKLVALD